MIFENAVEIILRFEGGLTIDPLDTGGMTNFGISNRSYPTLDIQGLTRAEAIEIYRSDYWDRYKLLYMPAMLRLAIFDSCVNHGPGLTVKMIQHILGITTDGILGQDTLLKLSAVDPQKFLESFCDKRFEIYAANKAFSHFGIGWTKRLLEIIFRSFDRETQA